MIALSTYECNNESCDQIVQKGDEIYWLAGNPYCKVCRPHGGDIDELAKLRLEVQELRQFCTQLILKLRERPIDGETCDYWWEKLTIYPKVEQ